MDIAGETNSNKMTPDLLFNGNFNDWYAQRFETNQTMFEVNWQFFRENCDIYYTNDYYTIRYNTPTWLHQYLMMYMINKKFFPEKKCLYMLFFLLESTANNEGVDQFQVKYNGEIYKYDSKPNNSPGYMYTVGLFSTAYGDGSEVWNSPFVMHQDRNFYGEFIKDHNNNTRPIAFKSYNQHGRPGEFVNSSRPMKNLDWYKAGQWAASENKDIIESNTVWTYIDFSVDNGATYVTGNSCLPSETVISKLPVVLYKPHSNGNEGLILFFNPWQNPITEQSYLVRLPNNSIKTITQIGEYASCARINI
jgi:hypothetical protein